MVRLAPLALLAALAACSQAGPTPPPTVSLGPPPPAMGLDRAMGRDAPSLIALFGPPALDIREGPARKLQFRGAACVLDAYLYPPAAGAPLRTTWVDARTPAGDDFDRASCIAALSRR